MKTKLTSVQALVLLMLFLVGSTALVACRREPPVSPIGVDDNGGGGGQPGDDNGGNGNDDPPGDDNGGGN